MPGYKTHCACAVLICAVGIACGFYPTHTYASIIAACTSTMFGALFPDTDTRSYARRLLDMAIIPVCLILWIRHMHLLIPVAVGAWCIGYCVPHRGMTHTLWFPICLLTIASICASHCGITAQDIHMYVFYCAAGYASHLVLDGII